MERRKKLYTVCHFGKSCGNCRHLQPLSTTYKTAFNPHDDRSQTIYEFIKQNTSVFVYVDRLNETATIAREIMSTGIKDADAAHIACAIQANYDYFLTTDNRVLKYRDEKIEVINSVDFIKILEGNNYK